MYVVLEGVDTTGKSTQIELLKGVYKQSIFTKEPSDSVFGKNIRELALYGGLCNKTQTMLFLADRAKHAQDILYPNLNKLIISDRSLISGIAYSSLNFDLLVKINLELSPLPNLAIILKTNEKILQSRLSKKENDNIEQNGITYLLNIQDRLIETVKKLGIDFLCLSCDLDRIEILNLICQKINSKL
ncbi:dTMP kinase [Helicobacter sp. MIT 14-3879]|uniref:dTMP kinase n=1 Tax=Helicobacter sp. MIT 14-3879 TaxID=2040649 RepID=UPI000E1E9218|nr:dTMP kinase [Helicobacter sp. MIT 14-3879]RDU62878.1 dTMP kinase [Helicobacter sp. MIT 14-3879]